MFEFDQFDSRNAGTLTRPAGEIAFADGLVKRSLLLWSEHCIECAAPECYQTCDLYRERPDLRCRRFDYGTRRNPYCRGTAGAAAEITFSQWGKLEARGNTVQFRSRLLSLAENLAYRLMPVSNFVGKIVRRMGGSWQWSSLSFELHEMLGRRLQQQAVSRPQPDGFLLEVVNPGIRECHLKFECATIRSKVPAGTRAPLPYWQRLSLQPGYNRIWLDYAHFRSVVESGIPYKLSLTPEAPAGTHLVFVTLDFVTLQEQVKSKIDEFAGATDRQDSGSALHAIPVRMEPREGDSAAPDNTARPAAKCVVFDLDNTLWEGVLLEGEVTLRPGVESLFKELDKRGILISIASKNHEQDATDKLAELGLAEYIVFPRINWSQKSDNIRTLARKISIGIDTFIFVDDNPFEREEVGSANPAIEVLPETALDTLLDHPRLAGSNTAEAAQRRVMYQQQIDREEAQIEFGDDYLAFLKECRIVVSIGPSADQHHERVAELLQRTNQLNFSGTRYTRDVIEQMLADNSTDKHIIHCRDKYGDYGIVGFSITSMETDTVTVQDFMLSCRVQGKLIEKAFFHYLAQRYLDDLGTLLVNFVGTDRNALARQVLVETGFSMEPGELSNLQVTPGSLAVDFLTLQSLQEQEDAASAELAP